jgi:hypothetical protein
MKRPTQGASCDPPKRFCADVDQAITSRERARKRSTHREPARRGYGYEEVRWQKSVRRIARPRRPASRKASRTKRRWPRSTPHDVLAHAAAAPR